MAKMLASNAVVSSVTQAAALYGVPYYREQSRAFTVKGAKGRERPMFIGEWVDEIGVKHYSGKPDLLLTPKIDVLRLGAFRTLLVISKQVKLMVPVPLWVECKYGSGALGPEQRLFRDSVLSSGGFYIHAHDSAAAVIEWFENMGVSR
jgi:hypothetical protein